MKVSLSFAFFLYAISWIFSALAKTSYRKFLIVGPVSAIVSTLSNRRLIVVTICCALPGRSFILAAFASYVDKSYLIRIKSFFSWFTATSRSFKLFFNFSLSCFYWEILLSRSAPTLFASSKSWFLLNLSTMVGLFGDLSAEPCLEPYKLKFRIADLDRERLYWDFSLDQFLIGIGSLIFP